MSNIEDRFSTVEEYIDDQITNGKIKKDKVSVENDLIVIDDYFIIDGSKVNDNLDWSSIIARSACVKNNKNTITKWNNLPRTNIGISGELPECPNLEEYLQKNANNRYQNKGDKFVVEGNLTIANANFDLSSVYVDGNVFWRSSNEVNFKSLPTANRIAGLNPLQIKTEKGEVIEYKNAHGKGLSDEFCKQIGAVKTNSVIEFFKRIKNLKAYR